MIFLCPVNQIIRFNADVLVVSRRLGYSSSEITLKHNAHLWSRNDEPLVEKMRGNIKLNFSKEPYTDFKGNHDTRMELVLYQNSAIREKNLE